MCVERFIQPNLAEGSRLYSSNSTIIVTRFSGQNYPNPFNPETWIPYHLSEAAPVTLSIYDATGQRIRTLSLGLQAAGFYQSRSRAAIGMGGMIWVSGFPAGSIFTN